MYFLSGVEIKTIIIIIIIIIISGALAREARSGAPWVTKCGKLPIRENLVIT